MVGIVCTGRRYILTPFKSPAYNSEEIVDTAVKLRTWRVRVIFLTFLSSFTFGCGQDDAADPKSPVVEIGPNAGYTARVSVADAEPASIGTYEGSVTYPDGRSFEIEGTREGTLAGHWLADLGGNAAPELILWIVNAGTGSYASIHIYWMREDGPLLQDISELSPNVRRGYMGHDSVFVERGQLKRCFPVDNAGNSETRGSRAAGQERCLSYNSMAGWVISKR